MASIFKTLHQNFTKLPENLPLQYSESTYFRYLVTANYGYLSSAIIHSLLIVLFFVIGVNSLALYNIASACFWGLVIKINLKGYWKTALLLAYIEVLIHSVLCTVIIGWASNFHYFLLIFPVVVFLAPLSTKIKALSAGASTLVYTVLSQLSQSFTPLKALDPSLLSTLHIANIFSFCFVLSYVAYYYSLSASQAEEKLEQAHRKTNSALVERNKALIRLNKELTEAADYVKTMLPRPIKEGPVRTDWKFIPSSSLGGDAFGYHWLDGENFAVYLLDVSGHGVGAALLSVSVMNALRSETLLDTNFCDPEQVLTALNSAFPSEKNNDMFFTIWYGVYNKSSQSLTYASGGHPPALLFGGTPSEKSEMTMLGTKNHVIGGVSDLAYKQGTQKVDNPSCMYIFSDGVYEIPKVDGSMWRLKEFAEFVKQSNRTGNSDIERIYKYARNLNRYDAFEDDFTLVEVVFTDGAIII
ncbi:MAG: PP2C family protein-serine/threonine phosphatase [Desulfobacterales bacterium]|nr:MAG: PP2C family protein-serine/threonine phosphatase [Desulfobacterales bacterium]